MAQQYCREMSPISRVKNSSPTCSPDLNAIDYSRWGYLQKKVAKRNPSGLDSLKLAIRKSAGETPHAMVRRAILAFRKMVKMCIVANGGPCKLHRLAPGLATYPIVAGHYGEEPGDCERDRIGIQPPTISCASICNQFAFVEL